MNKDEINEVTQMLKENSVSELLENEEITTTMSDVSVSELLENEEIRKGVMKVLKELDKD